jgi:PAS domain S-box-containing protein
MAQFHPVPDELPAVESRVPDQRSLMARPISVLHVDDEPGFADMVATYLERCDDRFDVHTATTPEDGLSALAARDIECIVCDYDMPGRDGFEVLERVREDHPDLPFILYTGKGSEEIASKAMSNGVTDYLQKERGDGHYEVLANAIENAVSQFRTERYAETMERRYQALFNQSGAAIAWLEYVDETPVVRDVNPEFETLFRAADEPVLGEDLDEVVATDAQSGEATTLSQTVLAGQSIRETLTRETVDGNERMHVQVIPVECASEGRATHAFAVYSEVGPQPLEQ